jgi:hypothetical protein
MVLQMVAGAGAGAFAKTATAPLERIKIIFYKAQEISSFLLGRLFVTTRINC